MPKDLCGRSGQEGVGHSAARGDREIPFSAEVRFVYLAKGVGDESERTCGGRRASGCKTSLCS